MAEAAERLRSVMLDVFAAADADGVGTHAPAERLGRAKLAAPSPSDGAPAALSLEE